MTHNGSAYDPTLRTTQPKAKCMSFIQAGKLAGMWREYPSPFRALLRGLLMKCPLCGGRKLFRRWIHFQERCASCGFKFEREAGFFMGGWLVNLAITEILLFLELMIYVGATANDKGINPTPFLYAAIVIAVIFPILFYPFSRTIWASLEIIAVKPTPQEQEDALDWYTERTNEIDSEFGMYRN